MVIVVEHNTVQFQTVRSYWSATFPEIKNTYLKGYIVLVKPAVIVEYWKYVPYSILFITVKNKYNILSPILRVDSLSFIL